MTNFGEIVCLREKCVADFLESQGSHLCRQTHIQIDWERESKRDLSLHRVDRLWLSYICQAIRYDMNSWLFIFFWPTLTMLLFIHLPKYLYCFIQY